MRLGQLIAHIPVLDRAQLGQGLVLGQQRVLVDPAHAGGVGADLRRDALGHAARGEVEVLQHARARPVDVGAVLEDDVDEGRTEEGEAAHHLGLRDRQHRSCQRIRDLILHHLRRLTRDFGIDDDLHVGQVGQGVDRRSQQRKNAPENDEQRGEQDQEAVPARPFDDVGEHGVLSSMRGAGRRLDRCDHPFTRLALDELHLHLCARLERACQ